MSMTLPVLDVMQVQDAGNSLFIDQYNPVHLVTAGNYNNARCAVLFTLSPGQFCRYHIYRVTYVCEVLRRLMLISRDTLETLYMFSMAVVTSSSFIGINGRREVP